MHVTGTIQLGARIQSEKLAKRVSKLETPLLLVSGEQLLIVCLFLGHGGFFSGLLAPITPQTAMPWAKFALGQIRLGPITD